MSESKEMKTRLAELRSKKAEREKARAAKAEGDELVELELEEKYSKECGGDRGVVFEILDTPDGHIVVKLGEWIDYKKFTTGKQVNGTPLPEDIITFALANLVYPTREKFLAINNKFGGVAPRCANALVTMHQGRRKDEEGKY